MYLKTIGLFVFFINYVSFGFTFKASVIDDLSGYKIADAKVIINQNDTLFTDKNGELIYNSMNNILHIDIYKIQYRDLHLDLDLSKINFQVLISLHPIEFHTHEVIVNSDKMKNSNNRNFTYSENSKSTNSNMSFSVGETLNSIKGVELRTMGAAPTRPIFRGLGNDRLRINIDGIENKDLSASSPDHNISLDPLSIKESEIIRGPEALKYSSSSSAGVINLINNEIPIQKIDNQNFELKNYYNTNNNGKMTYLEHQANLFDFLNTKIKFSKILSDNLNTPQKVLQNSNINSTNYEIGLGKIFEKSQIGLSYNYYENDYGIPPGGKGLHPKGVDIKMYKRDIKFIYNSKFDYNKFIKELNIKYLFNYLQHKEFESSGYLGALYITNNNILKLDLNIKNIVYANKSRIGLFSSYNYFDAGAAVRTPEVKDYAMGIYFIQSYIFDKINFDFAYRMEEKKYLPKKDISVNPNAILFERNFLINSFSSSLLYNFNATSNAGVIISYDERIPTLEELYSMGPHLASYSYDIGNQKINKENSINLELIFQKKFNYEQITFESNINVFNYYFLNYITPRNTGKIDLLKTRLPIYENQHISANLSGFENELIIQHNKLLLKNVTQFTYGLNINDNIPLPMIPPLKNILTLTYKSNNFDFSLISETTLAQNRIDEFELPTAGYSIINLKSNYYFYFFGIQNQLVFNIKNIFDSVYRNHLSRIKSIMPESGINFSIGLNNYF